MPFQATVSGDISVKFLDFPAFTTYLLLRPYLFHTFNAPAFQTDSFLIFLQSRTIKIIFSIHHVASTQMLWRSIGFKAGAQQYFGYNSQ